MSRVTVGLEFRERSHDSRLVCGFTPVLVCSHICTHSSHTLALSSAAQRSMRAVARSGYHVAMGRGAAPIPANERERLEALRALQILDTAPEEEFDAIVRLAAQICGVPVATVSLGYRFF